MLQCWRGEAKKKKGMASHVRVRKGFLEDVIDACGAGSLEIRFLPARKDKGRSGKRELSKGLRVQNSTAC